jgi:hypothetical protein
VRAGRRDFAVRPAAIVGVRVSVAAPIRAACLLLRIPRSQWIGLLEDVHFMGRCVAEERNRRAQARSR